MMDEATGSLVQAWLTKAQHDLGSAYRLAEGPTPYLDTAVYHCQQAAEKAVKALLTYLEIPFGRIHNISVLLGQGLDRVPQLSKLMDAAETLTPYATLYRYPVTSGEPALEEFEEALRCAERVYTTILLWIPRDMHPEST